MAKGRECKKCGAYMYALEEQYTEHGIYVKYQCTNNRCKAIEQSFEKKVK